MLINFISYFISIHTVLEYRKNSKTRLKIRFSIFLYNSTNRIPICTASRNFTTRVFFLIYIISLENMEPAKFITMTKFALCWIFKQCIMFIFTRKRDIKKCVFHIQLYSKNRMYMKMFKTSCCISFLRTAIFQIFPVHLHLNTYTCFMDYVIFTKY